MGDVIELDEGGRVDVASQKILIRLRKGGWVYTGELREVTELEQNSQVLYRLEEHLIPAGFVHEASRDRENEFRKFQLTSQGQLWVDNHEEELSYPASRAETQEMAYQAVGAAESAKESVQKYRKKVYRLRKKVDGLEGLVERVEDNETSIERNRGSLNGLRERKADESTVANVTAEFVEFRDEISEKHEGAVDRLGGRLDGQEMVIDELHGEIEQLREENEELREEIEVLREMVIVYRLKEMWKVVYGTVIQPILDYFQGKS